MSEITDEQYDELVLAAAKEAAAGEFPECKGKFSCQHKYKVMVKGVVCFADCRKCERCRAKRRYYWIGRCLAEGHSHEKNSVITLTYDNQHLPDDGLLDYSDVQKWLKRFRKSLPAAAGGIFGAKSQNAATKSMYKHRIQWAANDAEAAGFNRSAALGFGPGSMSAAAPGSSDALGNGVAAAANALGQKGQRNDAHQLAAAQVNALNAQAAASRAVAAAQSRTAEQQGTAISRLPSGAAPAGQSNISKAAGKIGNAALGGIGGALGWIPAAAGIYGAYKGAQRLWPSIAANASKLDYSPAFDVMGAAAAYAKMHAHEIEKYRRQNNKSAELAAPFMQ